MRTWRPREVCGRELTWSRSASGGGGDFAECRRSESRAFLLFSPFVSSLTHEEQAAVKGDGGGEQTEFWSRRSETQKCYVHRVQREMLPVCLAALASCLLEFLPVFGVVCRKVEGILLTTLLCRL
ncbi:hypothetical protein NDU88_003529 [Pleurodeles waltl]|uniref:Uncharacterized protein n=1 Tax=Pleurodeles waltl TaxID=8319 RepID=A0AAV7NPY6_PLEWA|nr:hypothetical protein NDU88_003529 [Pleurodeles waltl]